MKMQELVAGLPEYAENLRANFEALVVRADESSGLDHELSWGTMVVVAMVAGSAAVTLAVMADAAETMSAVALESAKRAAATMSLTNNFYRHHSLTKDEELKNLRSGLRLGSMRRSADKSVEYKLWCVALSVLNACGSCVEANEREARELGATPEQIAGVLRLGALVKAIAVVVEAERALNGR
jgi:alkyl hydroperoxide reductase subunit D